MYEVFDSGKTYTLMSGRVVTGQELIDDPQYPLVGKADCLIDILDGVVHSILGHEAVCEQYGVPVTDDKSFDAQNVNERIAANKTSVYLTKTTESSSQKAIRFFAETLTDDQAVEVADLYPEYEIGHEYKQNDRFQYGAGLYKVNQAHTSQEQWVPGEVGTESLYTNLMLNDSGHQIWKQPTGAHDAYNTGDVVEYKGTLYKSLIDGNVWAPDAYPQGWQEYDASTSTEPGTPEPGTPDPGTETYPDFVKPTGAHDAYKKGDIVRYNGKLYQSLIDANTYSPDEYPQGWQEYSEE